MNGLRMDRRPGRALGGVGGNGVGLACVAGARPGSALMIGLAVLYGFGGFIALALLAYLVCALIRAEAF